MKKIISCALTAILLILTLTGCEWKPKYEEIPVPTDITYTLDLSRYPLAETDKTEQIYGYVYGHPSEGVILIDVDGSQNAEKFGEYVLVEADNAADFALRDFVLATFRNIRAPEAEGYPLTVEAVTLEEEHLSAKPVIYLYPEAPTVCTVRVTLDGHLTCTYPAHGTEGWQSFTAQPDGTLIFPDGNEYYCLYWEGVQNQRFDFSEGFCVRGEDTAAFLADALPRLGLTAREANEFIIYWLPQMQSNAYNMISFQSDAYTDSARLDITPTPDTLIRVFMAWYASDAPISIPAQRLDTPARDGFTVVEWGGSEVRGK